jgi:hypothetical protein
MCEHCCLIIGLRKNWIYPIRIQSVQSVNGAKKGSVVLDSLFLPFADQENVRPWRMAKGSRQREKGI